MQLRFEDGKDRSCLVFNDIIKRQEQLLSFLPPEFLLIKVINILIIKLSLLIVFYLISSICILEFSWCLYNCL